MRELNITPKDENQRLDKFLMKYLNKAPKSFIYKMLRKKNIKYNNKKAEGNEIISSGDVINVYLSEDTINEFKEIKQVETVKKTFDIIYEDENILVCNKPAGLLSQKDKADDNNTLVDQIISYLYQKGEYNPQDENSFKPAICNRLDRNTSGVVIAGKNLMALQEINKAIYEDRVQKYYKTIVKGKIEKAGKLEDYHIKDEFNKVNIIKEEKENAKKVITKYKPLKASENYTLLEIELITGKTHQIRAHLQSIKHPIIGDGKYGDIKINENMRKKYKLKYQLLHAYKLIWEQKEGKLSYLYQKEFFAPEPAIFEKIENDLF